ncbi:MAG: transglycosylase domain-containing protein [Bacteroidales bacterium]|nr:transglycosylase domain-containing protein [Bacteroidales bacterium]
MPTFEQLENPENNLASLVYSEDEQLLGKYYIQNRSYVDFKEISSNIVNALIATEDIRFYEHSGIDARGLARVFFKTLLMGKSSGGGSTITQQLAKNLFPRDTTVYDSKFAYASNLVLAKFKEWITAAKLERNYTKKEILVMYLNTVPFGGMTYGIKSAARIYFNTEPDSLQLEEAATLVGMLKAPTRYHPVSNPDKSRKRRNVVLNQLKKYNYITQAQHDSLRTLPLNVDYVVEDHNEGLASYFREHLRTLLTEEKPRKNEYSNPENYKEDSIEWANNPLYGWCNKHTKPDGSHYDLYRDGLQIYTTINSKLQNYAEQSVREHLGDELQQQFFEEKENQKKAPFSKNLEKEQIDRIMERAIKNTDRYRKLKRQEVSEDSIRKAFNKPREMEVFSWEGIKDTVMSPRDSILYYKHFLRAGFMSMNPRNGHIKAYVGGPDYRYFKYDHVTQGVRQIGSTIKPFLYTLAMQEGYSPCHKVPNVPSTFYINDSTWTPKNSGPSDMDGEMVTLKWGLTHSVNYISAWLIKQFNPRSVINVMRKMGIESNIDPVPSIFLGTADISLYEMVGAYSTFANKGVYIEPSYVTRIEDRHGNLLATFNPKESEAISEQTAYLMTNLLKGVVQDGTGIRVRYKYELMNPIAGKTGTTQNQSDGWFMGVTPNLVSGAWVGGENRSIHFNSITQGQGANMALPIWAKYMTKVYNDSTLNNMVSKQDTFERPTNFNYDLDCEDVGKGGAKDRLDDEFF